MQDDTQQAQRLGAIDLFAQRRDRLRAQRRSGRRDIDKVAGMRDDRENPALAGGSPEGCDLFAR